MCVSLCLCTELGNGLEENKATVNKMEKAWYSINVINNPIRFY